MKRKFNTIKKSRKKSKDIDEKIEYLNKECQKTGLNEIANSTSGVYQGTTSIPNSGYAEITAKNFNGYPFAMSGDANLKQGNFGGASIRADGAALSPPHPVTGERRTAATKGGIAQGGIKIAIPGDKPTPSSRMTGPILWYYDPNAAAGQGSWRSLEYNSAEVHGNSPYPNTGRNAGWGYWGSGAFGFLLLRSDGEAFAPLFDALNDSGGNQFDPKDSVPETIVLTKDSLDNPNFLPVDIPDLSKEAFDELKRRAEKERRRREKERRRREEEERRSERERAERERLEKERLEKEREEEERKKLEKELETWKEAWARRLGVSLNFLNKMIYDMGEPFTGMIDDFLKGNTGLSSLDRFADNLTIPVMKTVARLLGVPTPANFMFRYDKWLGSGAKGRVDMTSYIDRGSMRKLSSVVNKLEGPMMKDETMKQRFKRLTSEGKSKEEALDNIATAVQYEVQRLTSAGGTGGKQLSHSIGNGAQIDRKAFIESGGKIIKFSKGYDFAENTGSVSGKSPLHSFVKGLGVELDTTGHGLFFWGTVLAAKYGLKNVNRNYKGSPDLAPQMPYSFKIPSGGGINESFWDNYEWIDLLQVKNDEQVSLQEGVGLGYFEPEVLNVDISDLRKGVMPEFPKDPPPEMIDGYSAKSKLAPKKVELPPFIKVTKKDLAKNHKLTDKEIQDFLDDIKMINDYIKKNPAELIYVMTRYPKDDLRLAQLNWQIDQKMNASEEYMETHFPENQRLFNKLQAKIKQNIELTDPKNFEGHKEAPKFSDVIDVNEQKKKTIAKYFKKPIKKSKNKIQRHINMKEVKKKNIEEISVKKLEVKKIKSKNQILKSAYERQKSDWKEDLKEFTGWQAVAGAGPTNATSQTFGYVDSGFPVPNSETGQQVTTTASGLGGVEVQPSVVNLDLGFGETMPVNPPTYDQLALAGYAKPILMKRKDTEDVNPKLDASQEFAQKVGADVMMNARVDNSEKTPDWYESRQKSGYYREKLGPIHGAMTNLGELKMNERLVQEYERQYEIYKKNDAIRAEHQKVIDKKIKPHLDKINSGLDKKIDLRTLYQRGAVVNDDGTRGLMIRRETTSAMGLSLTKTVITFYTGKNISTVGSVANREKLGITGQGKMTKVAEIKDPRLIEYKMPEELEMWQSQSVNPKGATTRSVGAQIAAKVGVKSAFDVLNYYIDNHVLNFDPNFDPNKRHNLTNLITDRTKDILQKGMNNLKPEIDAEIEKYKSMIPRIGEKQARSLLNDKLLGDGKDNMGLINSYFRSDSTINNKILQKIQRVDIFNSLGNNLGFDIDHYIKTGNYGFNSTYKFTSTLDMGVRVPFIGGVTSILSRKYVSGQLYGETMMAVQNPMQFRVDIDSGKQYTSEPSKTEPVSKQPTPKEPIKSKTPTDRTGYGYDTKGKLDSSGYGMDPNRDTETKTASKTVQRIKNMSKSKSVGFDRDDVSFRRKKED